METNLEEGVIVQKTKELCETILKQPEFQSIQSRIDQFTSNESAKAQFDALNEKGEFLHHKQHEGVTLSPAEVADFEKERDLVLANPVIRSFLDAQHEVHKIQETVGSYVGKTFELGRVPKKDDFDAGSCGAGCGCH
ncbi:MAG: YlbF family regulator [Verrucomicrobia bacterium]|nr:YlbF family regulator [Verrucomicrobiota bacterium]